MRRACCVARIDSHVQISRRLGPDVVRADDFASAIRAAAAVGTTIPLFALQINGSSRMEEKESLDNSRLKPRGSPKKASRLLSVNLERAATGLKGQRLPLPRRGGGAIDAELTCWSVT